MHDAKPINTPLASHFKLSKEQSPKTAEDCESMKKTPYASAMGSLMYAIVCARLDIVHLVRVVCRYMTDSSNQHWEVIK